MAIAVEVRKVRRGNTPIGGSFGPEATGGKASTKQALMPCPPYWPLIGRPCSDSIRCTQYLGGMPSRSVLLPVAWTNTRLNNCWTAPESERWL